MPRVLIGYATRFGTTVDVAGEIARVIRALGAEVDVRPIEDVHDLAAYEAVILGSAVRGGQWLPEMADYVQSHWLPLSQRPVAFFVVCLTMRHDTAANRQTVLGYLEPLLEAVRPVDVGLFAGALDCRRLPLATRLMAKAAGKPEGDFRDWNAIRAWAARTYAALAAGLPSQPVAGYGNGGRR